MKERLEEYKKQLSRLNEEQIIERNLYLKALAEGKIQGPTTGLPTIDKPWLKYHRQDAIRENMPHMTIYDYLYESNKNNLLNTALEYFLGKISYLKLFINIEKVAKSISALGVTKDDIVTLCMPSVPETIYTIYALNKMGIVVNLIDPRYSEDMIKELLNEVKSKYLITIDASADKIKQIEKETSLEKIIYVSPFDSLPLIPKFIAKSKSEEPKVGSDWISWNEFMKHQKDYQREEYKPNKTKVIVHTGGTTGKPKGVKLSDDNINSIVFQYKNGAIELRKKQSFLDIIPPFAAYGICSSIHMPLSLGMKTILIPKFNPKEFDSLLLKHKPTHVLGVPSFWEQLSKNPNMQDKDLSFLQSPGAGGDAFTEAQENNINEFLKNRNCKSKVIKGYGMSEVSSSACTCTDNSNELTSVGIPLLKTTIGIFDPETGQELPYDTEGEICITGPSVMVGYYENKELESKTIKLHNDGLKWVHTNDLGYMNKNGVLYFTGRIKRMIVRYDGFKIYPSSIEKVIEHTEGIDSVAVVKAHSDLGNIAKAFMVLNPNVKNSDEVLNKVLNNCKQSLAERSIPEEFEFIDELPKTDLGKIDYKALENTKHKLLKK